MRSLPEWTKHVATFVTLSASLCAQVAIENPQRLEVPEQRVQMLHQVVCRVAAHKLRIRATKKDSPVTLVLGEPEERIGVGSDGTPGKIYLKRWDETTFTVGDMQLVIQRVMIRERLTQMTSEVLRRLKQMAPVPARELTTQDKSSDTGSGSQTDNAVEQLQFWRRWNEYAESARRRRDASARISQTVRRSH